MFPVTSCRACLPPTLRSCFLLQMIQEQLYLGFKLHHKIQKIKLTCFYFEIQKLRLQSGLVRKVQVQFLWYGTRTGSRDKSGAYLFLPGDEGSQVRPRPLHLRPESVCPLTCSSCLRPLSFTPPQSPPWCASPEVPSSLTSLPVSPTSHTQCDSFTWKVTTLS